MMLACNCLNVIIEPESNDFLKVTADSLDLTELERQDSFFNQEIRQIIKLNKITKKISGLVTTRIVGTRWIVHHCINCNVHTHAIHRDRGAAFVLVSSKLLDSEAIVEIKKSDQYSPVFDINIIEYDPKDFGKSYDYLSNDTEPIVSSLRQRVNEHINRETVAVEDRIRRFTEEQYKALDEYRDKVFREHRILKRKILDLKLEFDDEMSTNINTDSPLVRSPIKSVPDNIESPNSPLDSNAQEIINNKSPIKKQTNRLSNNIPNNAHSLDTEVLFPLEDMDDEPTFVQSDFEESDQEDFSKEDSAEPVQRQKQSTQQLAKSLPVNIPVFMSAFQNHTSEDNDDELPDESMDIAASIKALAKSIQGGTVFGELPRSRFTSQI